MTVLRTQLAAIARRPSRLLLTGLAVLVASFVVYATVLARDITQRTILDGASGTPAAVDLVAGAAERGNGAVLTPAELAAIRALPGVAEAEGRAEAFGWTGNDYLSVIADPGTGPLATTRVIEGSFPARAGEIAVTQRTAERMGLPIGTKLTLYTGWTDDNKPKDPKKLTVTGIVEGGGDYGGAGYAPQGTVTALSRDTVLTQVDVRLAPGGDPAPVRAAVERVLAATPAATDGTPRPVVRTGTETRQAEAAAAVDSLDELFLAVSLFILVAVIAAALVATSTFRIVFAQRMRQLALLRAIGAGRGAISRALAAEGALTGLVTGVAGVLGALAVGHLVPPAARAFGATVSSPGVPVLPALGVVAMAVVLTVLAVLAPAATASRVAPLEALRSSSTTAGSRTIGGVRTATGVLTALAGALLAAYVIMSLPSPDETSYNPAPLLLVTIASGTLLFLALMALGPLLVRPVLAAVGAPLRRLGPVGKLAVGGVGGSPRRAAAVSTVVALGVTLIAGVLVTGASFRAYAEREVATSSPADFELTAASDARVSRELLDRAAAGTALTNVTPYQRLEFVAIGSARTELPTIALDTSRLPTLKDLSAATGSLAEVGPGKVAISGYARGLTGLATGDTTTLVQDGKRVQVRVVATLPDSGPLHAEVLAAPEDLTALGAPAGWSGLLADAAGAGEEGRNAGLAALRELAQGREGLGVTVLADQRDDIDQMVDSVLAVVVGLIGLTVLIAVVGVGTTTALSVVERARESGLLRALGLSRGGLRIMLTTESSLYGLLGAVLGLALGIPYAWLVIEAFNINAPLTLPVWQLAAVLVVLTALTALAGVLPARKAARVSPVAALGTE